MKPIQQKNLAPNLPQKRQEHDFEKLPLLKGLVLKPQEESPKNTYQAIGHAPFMLLGYVCYICKNHRKRHCKHSGDRDNGKVPPRTVQSNPSEQ